MADVEVIWQRGVEPDLARTHLCPRCGSIEHGRPFSVDGSLVSVSHAGDLHIIAISATMPVGVDVEAIDSARFEGFDAVALHPLERPHTSGERATTWVRKEALLKATGDGLTVDPRSVRLSDPDAAPSLLDWPDGPEPEMVHFVDLDLAEGHRVALAVISRAVPEVTVRRATP